MKRQRTRQAVDVTARKKKNKSAPARTAPSTLVAANSIPRRTTESRIVPRIPESSDVIMVQRLPQHTFRKSDAETRSTAR